MPIQKVGVANEFSMMQQDAPSTAPSSTAKPPPEEAKVRACHGMLTWAVQEPPFQDTILCINANQLHEKAVTYLDLEWVWMSQMNIFPHFVVLCTLNDYHRLFSIDYTMHHHASSCIIMHHHASSCITSSNLDLDAHSKGRCGKWIFHDANRMLRLQPLPPLQSRCLKRQWSGHVRGCQGSSAVTTFSGHNLVHQCSSTPWKGNNRYIYIYIQNESDEPFPHFVVLCTLNDYHRLFSIDYIMHHHASSCVPSSNLDLDAHSKGRCGKGNFHDANRMLCLQTRPPLQNRCLKRQWLGDVRGCQGSSAVTTFSILFRPQSCASMQFNSIKRQ